MQELRCGYVVKENETFSLTFITSKKLPDFSQITLNGTVKKLIVNGVRTAEESTCQFLVNKTVDGGYSTEMLCPSAMPSHAGTYIGTDNDDAENALQTTAVVVIVAGLCETKSIE